MGPILPAVQRQPSHMQRLGKALSSGAGTFLEKYQLSQEAKVENAKLKELGIDVEGLRGETKKLVIPELLKRAGQKQESEQEQKYLSQEIEEEGFDFNDPSSWSDKTINKLRSIKSKSPKMQTLALSADNEYKKREEDKKAKIKYQENVGPLEGALETVDQMINLGKKGNLGIGTSLRKVFSKEARKDASEYERLGKSLISFASNIPIRNRQEFETLAHDLYDPSINDASRQGILNAMKKIIQNTMKGFVEPGQEGGEPESLMSSERPPLESFIR